MNGASGSHSEYGTVSKSVSESTATELINEVINQKRRSWDAKGERDLRAENGCSDSGCKLSLHPCTFCEWTPGFTALTLIFIYIYAVIYNTLILLHSTSYFS